MSKFTVFFTGLSRADEAEVTALFDQARARLPEAWRLGTEAEAHVLVIDMDSIYGQMTLMKALDTDKVLVALTAGSRADTDHLLRRPLTLDAMVELLTRIAADDSASESVAKTTFELPVSEAVAAAPAPAPAQAAVPEPVAAPTETAPAPAPVAVAAPAPAPAPAPEPPPPAAPSREPRLVDYLRPGALPGPVMVQLPGAPRLMLDPASQTYVAGTALKPLIPYCTAVLGPSDLLAVDVAEVAAAAAKQGGSQPYSRLLWLSALTSGNGTLAPGNDINGSYKLSKWPAAEREFPKHFRIATLMLKGPAKLTEIAEQTGASLAEVIDFVNANLATGYATRG